MAAARTALDVDAFPGGERNVSAPQIIHLVYFPWDRNQRLLDDPLAFDRTPVEAMRAYAPDFDVRLWTYPEAKDFCEAQYPDVWRALQRAARPVMLVDVMRWVVVHHFGGLYWQLGTTPLAPMRAFLPSEGKDVRLFTEFELTPEQCHIAASEPIREGRPEEPTRVLIQAFSARPGATFVARMIKLQTERLLRHEVKRDYDILFITGNAAASTAYDRYGKTDPSVELLPASESRRLLKWHYKGTWRTAAAKGASASAPALPRSRSRWREAISSCRGRFTANPRESLFRNEDYRPLLMDWARRNELSRIVQMPLEGDPLIYPIPACDMLVIPDYLERLGVGEVSRVLRRVARARVRYVALTHHPLLLEWWPSATGDYRPINFCRAPINLNAPLVQISCPAPDGRPDRVLAVWNAKDLKSLL